MRSYSVYKHTTPSGKVYIGITFQDPLKRWKNGRGYEGCTSFYRAIQKYGWENIKHEIVAEGLSKSEACDMEQDLIARHNSCDPACGYNLTHGGEHYEPSDEWRKSLGASLRRYYKAHPEAREKVSRENTSRTVSAETRTKMSASRCAYIASHPEAREACGASFRGKKRSAENCEKLRRANMTPVICIDSGQMFLSVQDAAAAFGICRTAISNNLRGRSKTAGGHRFAYQEGNNGEA